MTFISSSLHLSFCYLQKLHIVSKHILVAFKAGTLKEPSPKGSESSRIFCPPRQKNGFHCTILEKNGKMRSCLLGNLENPVRSWTWRPWASTSLRSVVAPSVTSPIEARRKPLKVNTSACAVARVLLDVNGDQRLLDKTTKLSDFCFH